MRRRLPRFFRNVRMRLAIGLAVESDRHRGSPNPQVLHRDLRPSPHANRPLPRPALPLPSHRTAISWSAANQYPWISQVPIGAGTDLPSS